MKQFGVTQEGTKRYAIITQFCIKREIPAPYRKDYQEWLAEQWKNGSLLDIPVTPKKKKVKRAGNKDFYMTAEWRTLRASILNLYGKECMKCKSRFDIHCDHIIPRSIDRTLELEPSNQQCLCGNCNYEKSNKNSIDYRPEWAKTFDFATMVIIPKPAITKRDIEHIQTLREKANKIKEKKERLSKKSKKKKKRQKSKVH